MVKVPGVQKFYPWLFSPCVCGRCSAVQERLTLSDTIYLHFFGDSGAQRAFKNHLQPDFEAKIFTTRRNIHVIRVDFRGRWGGGGAGGRVGDTKIAWRVGVKSILLHFYCTFSQKNLGKMQMYERKYHATSVIKSRNLFRAGLAAYLEIAQNLAVNCNQKCKCTWHLHLSKFLLIISYYYSC
jgi:hypothetical protein